MRWRESGTTMNSLAENVFNTRPVCILELPLNDDIRVLHPEQVILKIGTDYRDVGAFCYALRSGRPRKAGQPTEVVLSSFLKQRPAQILQAIKSLSAMLAGNRLSTISSTAEYFRYLMNWADASGHADCLSGGVATRNAFRAYAIHVEDRFRRQEFGSRFANKLQKGALEILQAITGIDDLARGVRLVKDVGWRNGGTDPAPDHDFAHMLAMSQSLFDGLCDLVLESRTFPYKLELPRSLGWECSHLWVFPTLTWRLPPHQWGVARETLSTPYWPYDYQHGRVATLDEIWQRYKGRYKSTQRSAANAQIRRATRRINAANINRRDYMRILLAMHAHNAFCWLFHANTGGNQQPILDLETDGTLDKEVANQGYRNIKFRAAGKEVPIPVPTEFLPSLRRFMELRAWILNGTSCPYLFITLGHYKKRTAPQKARTKILANHINVLRRIDPKLKSIAARETRATVNDALLRKYDAGVVAKVLGHAEATELAKYGRGSVVDHRDDMTVLLQKISSAAQKQAVIPIRAELNKKAKELEQGGGCNHFGHPEAMTDDPGLQPDCAGGCWFCKHRMLVADEQDARKIASAAFVMEQLIIGPQHECKLRPLITKCESDLESIAQTRDCQPMVELVTHDVRENGNLTAYWAAKYHLFLELEVIA